MKISLLNTTLSCIAKCLRFIVVMLNKKNICGFLLLILLGACSAPTAMLGPAYSLTSGNIYQAGFSFGSDKAIAKYTGKSTIENLKDLSEISKKDENIQKITLESDDFHILVKNNFEKTKKLLKTSN